MTRSVLSVYSSWCDNLFSWKTKVLFCVDFTRSFALIAEQSLYRVSSDDKSTFYYFGENETTGSMACYWRSIFLVAKRSLFRVSSYGGSIFYYFERRKATGNLGFYSRSFYVAYITKKFSKILVFLYYYILSNANLSIPHFPLKVNI